jgi:hypothetical protein
MHSPETACVGVQVLPKGHDSMVWPFFALLGGLVTPGLVACAVDLWTKHSYFDGSKCWMLVKLLAIVAWLPQTYALGHSFGMVKYTLDCVFGMCFSQRAAQPQGLCDICIENPVEYVALLSAVMAVTEDLVFMGVASMLHLFTRQSTGPLLSTPAYCVSMLLSCMHVLMEAWEHFPGIHQDFGGCLAGVCSLPP